MLEAPLDQRPPANLEAEQALLVAILADNRQLDDIPDDFSAEHFADGAHGRIYEACCSLVAKNSQANAVTLSHLFEADEDLADIGGKAYLAQLQAAIPMGRARDYAGLITELWRLRQLLALCQGTIREIRESAADRSSSDLVTGITVELDRIDDAKDVGHLLDAGAAAEAWIGTVVQPAIRARDSGRVIGVPMGLKPMDDRLAGLRPGKLIILGAATSQFKSSLGIWTARQATLSAIRELMDQGASLEEACRTAPWTFVWSGEMDAPEQTGRMLAQATAVPYEDQSNGAVDRQQAALVADAAAAWRERPLIFADKPHLHIKELSRIVRRLYRQRGLRLVVVDYIQQIRGSDSRSREREVAEVAALLKELAMELHVPVLAMAQLSRQFFQRENKRPMLSDLRECVTGDTLVTDADTGARVRVDALRSGQRVMGVTKSFKVAAAPVKDVWSTGVKPIFRLTTASGRTIRATSNHPFLTGRGWVALGDLKAADLLAVAFRLPQQNERMPEHITPDQCRLLGYLAGNGTFLQHREVGLIIPDQEAFDDACAIIRRHWPDVTIRMKNQRYNDATVTRTYQNGYGKPYGNPLREWLRSLGVFGRRDCQKIVPDLVFRAGAVGAAEFLSGYLATDGCVTRETVRPNVRFDTTSMDLAQGVAHLLARLGVAASISPGYVAAKATRPIYRIGISSTASNLRAFCQAVRPVGVRGRKLLAVARSLGADKSGYSVFRLPPEVSAHAASVGHFRDQGKSISRFVCAQLAAETKDPLLKAHVESDVIWDGIRSIEPCGEEMVWDLSVPGLNSFVANGIAVHNSGAVEQYADVVLFNHNEHHWLKQDMPVRRPNEAQEKFNNRWAEWAADVEAAEGRLDIIIAKYRGGQAGQTATVGVHAPTARFFPLNDKPVDLQPVPDNPDGFL